MNNQHWWDTEEGLDWLGVISDDTQKPTGYAVGDRFRDMSLDGNTYTEVYILSQAYAYGVALICISSGNRWRDPIHVEDVKNISEGEWEEITRNGKFERTYGYY